MTELHKTFRMSLLVAMMTAGFLSFAKAAEGQRASDQNLFKELSPYVVVLNHPIYVYHWFNGRNRHPIWQTAIVDNDPAGFDHVFYGAQRYFQAFCSNNPSLDPADCTKEDVTQISGRSNMFGPGLYASVDPVATSNYAEGQPDWVLNQIHLPKGFRIANLSSNTDKGILSEEAVAELKAMGCGAFRVSRRDFFSTLLAMGSNNRGLQEKSPDQVRCFLNIRSFLKDRLKIEAVYYNYQASRFDSCEINSIANEGKRGNEFRQGAFVLAATHRLRPTDVKVFNSKTRTATEDRQRILNLFYQADLKRHIRPLIEKETRSLIAARYGRTSPPGFDGYFVSGSSGSDQFVLCKADNSSCQVASVPLDEGEEAQIKKRAIEQVQNMKMSTSNLSWTMKVAADFKQLLWSDLEETSQDPAVAPWIERNLLGCQDIAPMGPPPNLRRGVKSPVSAKGLRGD